MASGQSKIELILALNNRIGAGLAQARTQIYSEVGGMQARLGEFAARTRSNLASVGDGFAPIKSGLASLINPVTIAVAGVGLLAKGLMHATDRAADFNHEFRDLANLNLDKSQAEIDGLRKIVLNSAYRKGFNAEKTSNAYNELQSTAGIYGAAARPIVEKQGEFALLMKTSMDDYVAGTAKAMANWRFGVDKLDAFNKSNYAAMQVGVVSFEELAKVQSTFAGSAASINQSFDTANKLFSIFTVKTKSVNEAATLTKSLFNDLTKAPTIKAFKSVGIDLFDANKQLKQADVIMLELNNKFRQMNNDKAVVLLKNQFKGSEGLLAMIQAATDKTGELRNLLNEFQDSKFNADMALSQAHNSIIYKQEQLANRIDNLVIRMGQTLLPAKEKLVSFAEGVVNNVAAIQGLDFPEGEEVRQKAYENTIGSFGDIIKRASGMSETDFNNYSKKLAAMGAKNTEEAEALGKAYKNVSFFKAPDLYFWDDKTKMAFGDKRNNFEQQRKFGISDAYYNIIDEMRKARNPQSSTVTTVDSGSSSGGDLSGISDSLDKVVGSASAPRNITINIDAFNKGGINTQNTSLQQMNASQIEDWFTDMCMRVVNNAEVSYNN